MFHSCRLSIKQICIFVPLLIALFIKTISYKTTIDIQKQKRIKSLHLLKWTKIYYIENMDDKFIECGDYRCYVTSNKTELPQSDIVAFNPAFEEGKDTFFLKVIPKGPYHRRGNAYIQITKYLKDTIIVIAHLTLIMMTKATQNI